MFLSSCTDPTNYGGTTDDQRQTTNQRPSLLWRPRHRYKCVSVEFFGRTSTAESAPHESRVQVRSFAPVRRRRAPRGARTAARWSKRMRQDETSSDHQSASLLTGLTSTWLQEETTKHHSANPSNFGIAVTAKGCKWPQEVPGTTTNALFSPGGSRNSMASSGALSGAASARRAAPPEEMPLKSSLREGAEKGRDGYGLGGWCPFQ